MAGVFPISNISFRVSREQHKHGKLANCTQKGPKCPKGVESQDQQCKLRNCCTKRKQPPVSSCAGKEAFVQIKIRNNAETDTLPSPFQCFESGAAAFSAGGRGEESEQPDASAAETLRLLPEAGSSAHREVAPEETAYMTASLCSLLPQFIHV